VRAGFATDLIKDKPDANAPYGGLWASYSKDLKSCIGWQTPKFSGLVYRGALHSPLEIFIMSFKRRFYIPSFTSTAVNPNRLLFNPFPDSNADSKTAYQNIIFEIDTSNFPNFSTLIQTHQTQYPDETECLLSCYNIYSWQGFRVNKFNVPKTNISVNVGIVSLKVEVYEQYHDLDTASIVGPNNGLDETWLGRRGEVVRTREMTASVLNNNLGKLWDSYDRTFGTRMPTDSKNQKYPLDWLNATFTMKNDIAQWPICEKLLELEGSSLDNFQFTALEQSQIREKQASK